MARSTTTRDGFLPATYLGKTLPNTDAVRSNGDGDWKRYVGEQMVHAVSVRAEMQHVGQYVTEMGETKHAVVLMYLPGYPLPWGVTWQCSDPDADQYLVGWQSWEATIEDAIPVIAELMDGIERHAPSPVDHRDSIYPD